MKRCSVIYDFMMNSASGIFYFFDGRNFFSVFQIPLGLSKFSSTQAVKYSRFDSLIDAITTFLARLYWILGRCDLSRMNTRRANEWMNELLSNEWVQWLYLFIYGRNNACFLTQCTICVLKRLLSIFSINIISIKWTYNCK